MKQVAFLIHAGSELPVALLERPCPNAQKAWKGIMEYAIRFVGKAIMVMDQIAGKTAQNLSSKMVITAASLMPTAEALVKSISTKVQNNGVLSGTPNATKTIIMSAAVSARQTARLE